MRVVDYYYLVTTPDGYNGMDLSYGYDVIAEGTEDEMEALKKLLERDRET